MQGYKNPPVTFEHMQPAEAEGASRTNQSVAMSQLTMLDSDLPS